MRATQRKTKSTKKSKKVKSRCRSDPKVPLKDSSLLSCLN